jgi:hypothetical protein
MTRRSAAPRVAARPREPARDRASRRSPRVPSTLGLLLLFVVASSGAAAEPAAAAENAENADPSSPPCLSIDMSGMEEALATPCADPALACSHEDGCVGAFVRWLAPQFENQTVEADAYEKITPAWMLGCVNPHLERYLEAIPLATFVGLQRCDYSGYVARWPALAAFDFSSISPADFVSNMPPGMLATIMRAQRARKRRR